MASLTWHLEGCLISKGDTVTVLFVSRLSNSSKMWLATETHWRTLQVQHQHLDRGTQSQLPQAIGTVELRMPRSLDTSRSPFTRDLALYLPPNDAREWRGLAACLL